MVHPKREPLSASCYPIGLRTTSATMKSQSPEKILRPRATGLKVPLQGLNVTRTVSGCRKRQLSGPDAAIPHLRQQLSILKSVKARFESSLFDIRQLVQADLFDSEIDTAGCPRQERLFSGERGCGRRRS